MNILIRKVDSADNKVLANIIRSCFVDFNAPTAGTVFEDPTTDDLAALFNVPQSVLYVAEMDGVLAGCCGIYPTADLPTGHCELVKFYVGNQYRGKGIGKLLFDKSLDAAKELGYTNVYIESLPEFGNAVSMYLAYGFHHIEAPLGNSGHPGCTIWMIKELAT